MEVKEAVEIALKYFFDLYPKNNFKDILLEETELSDDEKFWYVTIGYSIDKENYSPISSALGLTNQVERKYKIFKINNSNKKVVSMKIRSI